MSCAPGLIFDGNEGVGPRFHILRARTHFLMYRGRRAPFSCLARPNLFSAVPRASGLVFMFCTPGLIFGEPMASCLVLMFCAPILFFGGTEGVRSRVHVMHARTHFGRYRGRQVPFSFSARPDSFSAIARALGSFFMFCATGLVFDGTEDVGSRFQVLRSQTRFRRYRGRLFPLSCFARPDSFAAVPRASGPVFMFCAHRLVFSGTEDVGSHFQVLRSMTHFRRYRGSRFPFSCFASPDSFLDVPRESDPVFMFCALGLIFGRTECVGSRLHVLRSRSHFRR
jgi:hypothetical protein